MGSIKIHDLGRCLGDRNPDDERKDGDAVGGNGQVGKVDRNLGQGTGGGDNNRNDNFRMECRLSFNFECKFHAGKGGNCIKNCKECAGEGRLCKRREPGTMQQTKVTSTASPWFLGVGKNLVVRK
jgi:hypothetical protein